MKIRPNRWFHRLAAMKTRPVLVEHMIAVDKWRGPELSIAVISDLHVAAPFTSLRTVEALCQSVTNLRADLIVLAGDFLADRVMRGQHATAAQIAAALEPLDAPLGVFAILGNHDWQDCPVATKTRFEQNSVAQAFEDHAITLLRNQSVTRHFDDHRLNIVGFDSQRPMPRDWSKGLHAPDPAFADVDCQDLTLLLAHEPDYFAQNDTRADVQISGHTHGGQVNLMGWRPIVPSQFGARYAHGHIRDGNRHLVVSGGIGFSGLPLRLGQPAEITKITIQSGLR